MDANLIKTSEAIKGFANPVLVELFDDIGRKQVAFFRDRGFATCEEFAKHMNSSTKNGWTWTVKEAA